MTVQMTLGMAAFVSFFFMWVVVPTFVRKRIQRKLEMEEKS